MSFVHNTPSAQLLKEVRAALILRDSSLSALADEIGVKRQNLTKALKGDWTGPRAAMLVAEVCKTLREKAPEC